MDKNNDEAEAPQDQTTALEAVRTADATISNLLQRNLPRIKKSLDGSLPEEVFAQYAMNSIRTDPKLLKCTPGSIIESLIACAERRLMPGPNHGYAYLVPFWSSKQQAHICTLIIGYRGMLALCHRSPKIRKVEAQTVHENDHFELGYGIGGGLTHRPDPWGPRTQANCLGAYCLVTLENGDQLFERMSKAEIERIRKVSKTGNSSFWKDWWLDQARKSTVRKISRWLPLEPDDLEAIMEDERSELEDSGPREVSVEIVEGGVEALNALMDQGEPNIEAAVEEARKAEDGTDAPISEEGEMLIHDWLNSGCIDLSATADFVASKWGVERFMDLSEEQASELLEMFRAGDLDLA